MHRIKIALAATALSSLAVATAADEDLGPAGPAAFSAFRDCEHCPEMVVIPPGQFEMGAPDDAPGIYPRETPRHRVRIASPFAVGRYEVTRAEFAGFVAATGLRPGRCLGVTPDGIHWNPEVDWRDPGFAQTDQDPVVCVNWQDSQAYTEWLSAETGYGYRLLSEAEWEYVARAFTVPADPCVHGNIADRSYTAFDPDWPVHDCRDGHVFTAPVGSFAANAVGVHDMLGNVWEWVADCWHDDYRGAPADGRAWTGGDSWMHAGDCPKKVMRGASWFSFPRILRLTYRDWDLSHYRVSNYGFRVARDLGLNLATAEAN